MAASTLFKTWGPTAMKATSIGRANERLSRNTATDNASQSGTAAWRRCLLGTNGAWVEDIKGTPWIIKRACSIIHTSSLFSPASRQGDAFDSVPPHFPPPRASRVRQWVVQDTHNIYLCLQCLLLLVCEKWESTGLWEEPLIVLI